MKWVNYPRLPKVEDVLIEGIENSMNISLCMIVKNEEEVLSQSLSRVSPYVDEIIVVDTGSTDGTKEIARTFTAKVYDFPWCDDFSAARNFSLEKASYDWVLVLDADEVIKNFDSNAIKKFISNDQSDVGRINIINIVSDPKGEKRSGERISRLFNRRFFHYKGPIHEQIVNLDGKPYKTLPVGITVEHRGYTQEAIQRTDKITRNITLLKRALEKSPEDDYLLFQLGKSYYMAKNYAQSVACFQRALALPLNFSLEYVKNLVETYGYALINSSHYAEALSLKDYETYYAGSTDYLFLMGLVYMNNGQLSSAIEYFTRCLNNNEGKVAGLNSYLPNFNIAVIYECLGYKAEAVSYYQKCGSYPAALKRLEEI